MAIQSCKVFQCDGSFEWDPFTTVNGAQAFCRNCRVIHSWSAEREDWWFGPGRFMVFDERSNETLRREE
jgi:hypothetical protein